MACPLNARLASGTDTRMPGCVHNPGLPAEGGSWAVVTACSHGRCEAGTGPGARKHKPAPWSIRNRASATKEVWKGWLMAARYTGASL